MPLNNQSLALYEVDLSVSPPSCLPIGVDKSKLRDVTQVGDLWRKYLHVESGEIHEGAKHYANAMGR